MSLHKLFSPMSFHPGGLGAHYRSQKTLFLCVVPQFTQQSSANSQEKLMSSPDLTAPINVAEAGGAHKRGERVQLNIFPRQSLQPMHTAQHSSEPRKTGTRSKFSFA